MGFDIQDPASAPCRPKAADRFSIERRFTWDGFEVDIRRFRWPAPSAGDVVWSRHYLDMALMSGPRLSSLHNADWGGQGALGDVIFIPAGQLCSGVAADGDDNRLLCATFEPAFMERVLEGQSEGAELNGSFDVGDQRVRSLMAGLSRELQAPGLAADVMIQASAMALAVELHRHFGAGRLPGVVASMGRRRMRRACDYIRDNLAGLLSLSDIAAECGVGTRHLNRIFKREMGVTLGDYVVEQRVAHAKRLLGRRELLIKEVMGRCGFSSPSTFAAAFKRATGRSPSAYRRMLDA